MPASATGSSDDSGRGVAPTQAHDRYLKRARQRDEPTQTKTVRSRYAKRLRGRWRAIRTALRKGITEHDALALQTEALVEAPREFAFSRDAERVPSFDDWLQRQTEREILQQYGGENQFITKAYQKGVDDARTELRVLGLSDTSAKVGATAIQLPVHQEQLAALYNRNLGALKGMTEATANQMRRELSEGLAAGDGPYDIADRLADRIDAVGITRANTIARTEIMHSHLRARATEWGRSGIQTVDLLLAPDACELCLTLKAGEPYPIDEAPGLLPRHPNCRCSIAIHTSS